MGKEPLMAKREFSFEDSVRKLFNHERRIAAMEKHDTIQDESFKKNDLLRRVEALEAAAKK